MVWPPPTASATLRLFAPMLPQRTKRASIRLASVDKMEYACVIIVIPSSTLFRSFLHAWQIRNILDDSSYSPNDHLIPLLRQSRSLKETRAARCGISCRQLHRSDLF